MAIVSMQKVAVLAPKSRQEPLLQLLHEEGVLEISEARESSGNIDHTEVNFRAADLEFAIATLKNVASKKTLSALKKAEGASPAQVQHAAHHVDVLAIVEKLNAMEDEDRRLEAIAAGKGVAGQALGGSGAESPVFLSAGSNADIAKVGGDGDAHGHMSAAEEESRAKARKQLERNAAAREKLAEELPNLAMLRTFLRWLGQKQAAREAMRTTKSTVMLRGWIPENKYVHLQHALQQALPDAAIVPLAADDGETPPVQLRNNPLLTPFESVTKLYGLPQYHEMDPTPYLSLFFILFFALCLTDAGYGLVQALLTGLVILKMKIRVKDNPLVWLLFVSGIVTFFVSIPFGGWFGMTAQQAPAFMTETRDGVLWFKGQVWNLGDQTGISFLQNLALTLGVVHLTFGIVLSAAWKIRNREYAAAFWQDISTLSMIGSLVAAFFGPAEYKPYANYVVYAALAFMVWGKGYGSSLAKRPFMGFLQTLNWFLGMLGNVLSYLRILALGLVTGALAFTVNLVAEQIGALLPWFLVIPFMITVYVVGHAMNIALNVLGAFIHSGRLQFVEFFSQFFEGGGRPFKPFARS